MATQYWTGGANDGDWTTAGNWTTAVPGAGDHVYINATDQDITTGPASAINLATFIVGPEYRGSMSALIALGTITTFRYNSGGPLARLSMTVAAGNIELGGNRRLSLEGGSWGSTLLGVAGTGHIEVASTAALYNVDSTGTRWTIQSSAEEIVTFNNSAGRVIVSGRDIEGVYRGWTGSHLVLRAAAGISDGSNGAIADIGPGSALSLEGTANHDLIYCRGFVDQTNVRSATVINTMRVHPGGRFNQSGLVTYTNPIAYVGVSGSGSGISGIPL